jgi:hypothetical protein
MMKQSFFTLQMKPLLFDQSRYWFFFFFFLYLMCMILGNAIREWRQAGGHQSGMLTTGQAVHDPIPSPTVSASRKKQKMTSSIPSQSFVGPSPSFHPPAVSASHQPSSSAAKRGPGTGPKGKKQKPVSEYS